MPAPTTTTDAESLKRDGNIAPAIWSVAISGLVLTLLSLQLFGVGGVVSTASGGALAVVNLWVIARMVRGFLGGPARAWGPIGLFKLAALLIVLGILLKRGFAEVLPLAL